MYCGHCGTRNPVRAKYCRECGARLDEAHGARSIPPEEFELPSLEEIAARVRAHLSEAYQAYDRGEWDQAIAACTEALKAEPASAEAHSLMGSLYERKGEIERAVREYETAVQLNPSGKSDRLALARLRGEPLPFPRWHVPFPDWVPAVSAAGAALVTLLVASWILFGSREDGMEPHPTGWVQSGESRLQQGQHQAAAEAFREALRVEAGDPRARQGWQAPQQASLQPPATIPSSPMSAFQPLPVPASGASAPRLATLPMPGAASGARSQRASAPSSGASPAAPAASAEPLITLPPVAPEAIAPSQELVAPARGPVEPGPSSSPPVARQGYIRLEVRPPGSQVSSPDIPPQPPASTGNRGPRPVVPQERDLEAEARTIEQRASQLARQGRYDLAIIEYKHALRTAPNYSKAGSVWQQIGLCQQRLGNSGEALTAYRQAEEHLRQPLAGGASDPASESALRAVRSARELIEGESRGGDQG